jgi:hypothetical protein
MQRSIDTDKFAVHFHMILRGRLYAEICAWPSVDRNAAGRDQIIAMTARTDAGRGEKAVETHGVAMKR